MILSKLALDILAKHNCSSAPLDGKLCTSPLETLYIPRRIMSSYDDND